MQIQNIEESELIKATFDYWFSENNHVRSPFPDYVRKGLKEQSVRIFF